MAGKKEMVQQMFDDISPKYDFLNHFLSFGTDYGWRRRVRKTLAPHHPKVILDIATGTGDLAIELLKLEPEKIYGIDISERMLNIGRDKVSSKGLADRVVFYQGDAENIAFPDNKFDAVTVAFGVRNFEDLSRGLSEMCRVLKPGGRMLILEFSHPRPGLFGTLYRFYSRRMLPLMGKIISRHNHAYTYLPESVASFPSGEEFTSVLQSAGMRNISMKPLSGGIATLYTGEK